MYIYPVSGPWTVCHDPSDPKHIYWIGDQHQDASIAEKVSEANARLIAAAPDMLEALEKIEAEALAPIEEMDVELTLERIICVARAAIAKAIGEPKP